MTINRLITTLVQLALLIPTVIVLRYAIPEIVSLLKEDLSND